VGTMAAMGVETARAEMGIPTTNKGLAPVEKATVGSDGIADLITLGVECPKIR